MKEFSMTRPAGVIFLYKPENQSDCEAVVISKAEYDVLQIIGENKMTVRQISHQSQGEYSHSSVNYSLDKLIRKGIVSYRAESSSDGSGVTFKGGLYKWVHVPEKIFREVGKIS